MKEACYNRLIDLLSALDQLNKNEKIQTLLFIVERFEDDLTIAQNGGNKEVISPAEKYWGRIITPLNTLKDSGLKFQIIEFLKAKLSAEAEYKDRNDFYNRFYTTPEWGDVSLSILKRDHYMCQIPDCRELPPAKYVHHIRDAYSFPHLRLDPENLITICKKHHDQWHDR